MPPYTLSSMTDIEPNPQWGDLTSALHNILPYGHDLEQEATDMLSNIVLHFGLCLKAEDWAPGALYWAKQLNQYLDLKYALPLPIRVAFAKIFYELALAPGMDSTMLEQWCVYCRRLIKKKDLIGPKDLTLPWRPFYDILERTLFPKNRQRALLSDSKRMVKVVRLIEEAQRFFPREAAAEILEEFLPKMTTSNLPEMLKAQTYIGTFLPTDMESGMDPREWMPTIFNLWTLVVRSNEFDRNFLSLLGRVARDNVGIKDLFTDSQIRTVFSAGLRALNLPVGKGQASNAVDSEGGTSHKAISRNDMRMTSFVMFIVNTINPISEQENPKSSSLAHLRDLIQATESYFHPSNSGHWTYALSLFLQAISWDVLKRLKEEEASKCKTPKELRLTPELVEKFVLTIKNVTFLMLFSKDQRAVAQTHFTLRYLAWLAPKHIIPGVLERAYPSLESLTETHRTTSVISALGSLAVPLLNRDHYPQGGKHLTPLLHLTVPGVDLNDPVKTWYTLMFVTSMISTVPVRDLTEMGSAGFQWGGMEEENLDEMIDMELEDSTRKATTAEFEEWLMKFLRRAILMFENYPELNDGEKKDAVEGSITGTISYCFEILFAQLSPKLYDMTTKLVVELLESAPMANAATAMGAFVSCWASANRKQSMAKLFPILDREIRSELEHGASAVPSLAYSHLQRDKSLHYYQGILNQLIQNSEILGHRREIIDLVKLMANKCHDREGYDLTSKLMVSALHNMLLTYTNDIRSHDPARWNDEAFMAESHKHWGEQGDAGSENIDWHIPSKEEIDFAIELIDSFHVPALARARELMTDPGMLEGKSLSIELCKAIMMIKGFTKGMISLVEDDGDSPPSKASLGEDAASIQPLKPVRAGYCLTDPKDPRMEKIRKIRGETGAALHELMTYFQTKKEDDVENIKALVDTARIFLSNHGVDSSSYESSKKGYDHLKQIYKLPGDEKIYPRVMHCRRATSHHFLRLKVNSFGRAKTELHDALFMDLTEFSLSQYTVIRKRAQQALLKATRCFQGSKNLVIPVLLKALESSNTDYERMKGALFLLSAKSLSLPCLRDWRFVPDYVLRLCMAHHADKPSVQLLIRKNFIEYVMNMTNTSFKVLVRYELSEAIQQFDDANGLKFNPDAVSRAATKAKNRCLNNIKAYDNLLVSLTELVQDPTLHWRYQTMTMSFMELLMRPEIPCSLEIAQYETKCLLSEMPTVRRIALSSLSMIMVNTKIRMFAQGDPYSLIIRKAINPLKRTVTLPEVVPDAFTEEYLRSSVSDINYEDPESSLLNDAVSTGWLVWPKTFKAYLPNTDSFVMPEVDADSKAAFEHLEEFFGQASFWEKMIDFMAQEPVRGERHDAFSSEHARLYKSIFGLWQDRFLGVLQPALVALCGRVDDKNAQRTAAELIGGLIRGSKHWKKRQLEGMWSWLTPLLKKTFQVCTPDSLVYWERFVKYCCLFRDPRRVLPLIRLIFETPLDKDSTAAFSESKNLFFTRAVLVTLSWRVLGLTKPRLREGCLEQLQHPYKQVREILGHVVNELFQLEAHPSFKNVKELLADQRGVGLNVGMAMGDDKAEAQVKSLVGQLEKWRAERQPSVQGSSDYTNASKTVLAWVFQALSGFRVQATYGVVLPLLGELFKMQDIPDDQDLQQPATLSLLQFARFAYPAEIVPHMVDLFCGLLKPQAGESWHIRSNVLPVVQIFFYTNLFSLDVQRMVQMMEGVAEMLLDPQIEVRQLAATTLSGIVRCSQREATTTLIGRFKELLATPLPSRKRDRTVASGGATGLPAGYTEAIVKRHAGVLGLASLLEAFPYEVPKWMPEVMVFLSKFFGDPAPISTTVKKAFGDFKRTHQDTWHEDQKAFEAEELEVLADMLISPSYYA